LVEIRGNVETRLRKLADGEADALILAEAGLGRLGLESHITEVLDPQWMFPAVGQGALGLECRSGDDEVRGLLARVNVPQVHAAVLAERAFLLHLGGGCQVPLGVHSHAEGSQLRLRGAVLRADGGARIEEVVIGETKDAEAVGRELAERMLRGGARAYLSAPT
jgi:hydroxymethylbilane synthase